MGARQGFVIGVAAVVSAVVAVVAPVAGARAGVDGPDLSAVEVTACSSPVTPCVPLPELGWEGEHRSVRVELPSARTGATLRGTLFAPPVRRAKVGRSPGIVIVPGSGGSAREEHYHWSARELAANGYVVLGVDPQGVGRSATFGSGASCSTDHPTAEYPYPCEGVPFQQDEGFVDAHLSGVDFLLSDTNPWRRLLDADRIGLAGHSLGAGSAAIAQERDARVGAIVAWDSLNAEQWSTDQNGPQHHAVAGHVPVPGAMEHWLTPRVPAMGVHSGHTTLRFYDTDPNLKSSAFGPWRAAGLPVMTLNLEGVTHGDFSQAEDTAPGSARDRILRRVQHYTRAWFDLHLRGDSSAGSRLLASSVDGVARADLLSATYPSKAYVPSHGVDCEDFRSC